MVENKKGLAIVLAADDKFAPALGVALLSLKQNSPRLFARADFFVYTQDMRPQTKEILQKICPINFKDFTLPFSSADIKTIKQYTELTLSRYECFYMLADYQNVLWLDIDILAAAELEGILEHGANGIAMAHDLNFFAFNFLKSPGKEYDLRRKNFNAGVLLLTDSLQNHKEIGDWCYEATLKWAPILRFPDQAVLNAALQHFNLQPAMLPAGFNAHPFSAPVPCYKAALMHAMGKHKFWTDCPLPAWYQFYTRWQGMGGAQLPAQKHDAAAVMLFKTKLFIEKIPILWVIFNFINKYRFKKLNEKILREVNTGD